MATSFHAALQVNCSVHRPRVPHNLEHFRATLSSTFKPLLGGQLLQQLTLPVQIDVPTVMKNTCVKLLDAFVDSVFEFVDQPWLPSQANFGPVEEIQEAAIITDIEGKIPDDFPEGVYIRNGPNPLFGTLKATKSVFGRTSYVWVEGEGMLHALYFKKATVVGSCWTVLYNNRHVETETLKLEKERNKPSFLPATEGDSLAVISAFFLNSWRFGKVNRDLSNTIVIEHAGKFYSVAENHIPQEIDILTLETIRYWDVNGAWNRPFTSHPKKVRGTGELVIVGVDAVKPFMEVGIISADGKRLVHKADLRLNRCTVCHEIGVTERYNVIMDFPLTIDLKRLARGGPLIKFDKEDYARIGIMPRYGDADSVKWFEVEPNCTFHILNSFEDGNEVVIWGNRALESIIPGPHMGLNKFEWFSKRLKHIESVEANSGPDEASLFTRCYEWRLNMQTGEVKERYLTGTEFSMDFPMINGDFTGVKNKYGYMHLVDSDASSNSGMAKYGGLAKLCFESGEEPIKVEYHKFEKSTFCTGAAFVPKIGSLEEVDGWIIAFVHSEDTNVSKAYIVDTKNFTNGPVAKIKLPCRVPYGFHGSFMPQSIPF